MPNPQNFKNHTRWDPPMHFFVFPVLALNFFFSIYIAIHHWPVHSHLSLWWIVVSLALVVLSFKSRINDLKIQDRIIRIEERHRLHAVLPITELPHIDELSTRQLIALRFASDEELPALVHKALTQDLEPQAIKENIHNWRADNDRV